MSASSLSLRPSPLDRGHSTRPAGSENGVLPGETSRPRRDSLLVYGSPRIEEDEIQEVVDTLRSGWIGTGPRVHEFENRFREYVGAAHAVAVNSCTAALHLAMKAANLGPGDEVITTPMTFCATANAIIHAGATPVFADCGRSDMNIDPAEIERRITPRTRAILPVHFGGRPCEMAAIMDLARSRNLLVIEDCAHSIESRIGDRHLGTFGDFGCYSFYVTKNLTTGEGGMVVTPSQEAAAQVKMLALHGMTKDAWKRFGDEGYRHYEVVATGFKYNMMDIQAALGLKQLEKLERYRERRRDIWDRYNEAFADLPCMTPLDPDPGTRHAYHLYPLLLDLERLRTSRDEILQRLFLENIGTGVHYIALHLQPYYQSSMGLAPADYPNALWISERTLSLPLSAKLTDEDVADVIAAVRKVLRTAGGA